MVYIYVVLFIVLEASGSTTYIYGSFPLTNGVSISIGRVEIEDSLVLLRSSAYLTVYSNASMASQGMPYQDLGLAAFWSGGS
jgi:hypothetical protein